MAPSVSNDCFPSCRKVIRKIHFHIVYKIIFLELFYSKCTHRYIHTDTKSTHAHTDTQASACTYTKTHALTPRKTHHAHERTYIFIYINYSRRYLVIVVSSCFRNVFGIENFKDHENFMNEAKKNILDRTSVWNARISITGIVRNEIY